MNRPARIEHLQRRYSFYDKLGKRKRTIQIKVELDALMDEQLKAENLAETIRRDLELLVNTDRAA